MQFTNPREVILQMGLHSGDRVGDFGAGVGHHAFVAAKIVGDTGRVYAVDVQEEVLKTLRNTAVQKGIGNIETIWGDIESRFGTRLRGDSLDAVILSNTLFQTEDKDAVLKEIFRTLKPGGRVLVIDWSGAYGGIGPDEKNVIPEHVAEKLFLDAGFYKEKTLRIGPHHYALIMTKPS